MLRKIEGNLCEKLLKFDCDNLCIINNSNQDPYIETESESENLNKLQVDNIEENDDAENLSSLSI